MAAQQVKEKDCGALFCTHIYYDSKTTTLYFSKNTKNISEDLSLMGNLLCFVSIPRGYSHQSGFDPQLKQAQPWMMTEKTGVAAQPGMPSWDQKDDQAPSMDN